MSLKSAYGRVRSRPYLALVGAVACLGVTGGAAYAAVHSEQGSARQAVLTDAAHRLGVTPTALKNALQQAAIDQVKNALADGKLTKAQADAIIAHIKSGQMAGPPMFAHGFGFQEHRFGVGRPPVFGDQFGRGGMFDAAATYLKLSPHALFQQLRSGKTLAQVATAQGKPVSGLEDAMAAAMKSRLDQAVKDGHLTATQEKTILAHVKTMVDDIVNGTFGHDWDGHHGSGKGPDSGGPQPTFVPPPA
ncbi:MAG: hypothetical protein ACTHNU_04625 [Gaiellales bacterium]